ncbi:MAG: sigma 54-interacting transcriptional regulator, partial [Sandaracinaceae bacterium]
DLGAAGTARLARARLATGDRASARAAFLGASASSAAWRALGEALVAEDPDDLEPRLHLARAVVDGGDARAAVTLLDRDRGSIEARLLVVEACFVLLRLDDARDAIRELPEDDARTAEARARHALLSGRASDAIAIADPWIARAEGRVRARLHEVAGAAAGYLGDAARAEAHLAAAGAAHEAANDRRGVVRVASYRAIGAFVRGRWTEAKEGYARALELAEAAGHYDQVPVLCLNLATAHEELEDLGGALALYERAARLAGLVGQTGTAGSARFAVANLYAEIGAFDRAAQVHATLTQDSSLQLSGPVARLAAEIALGQGDVMAAMDAAERACAEFAAAGASRDVAEAQILRGSIAARAGRTDVGRDAVRVARPAVEQADAPDLAARLAMLEAQLEGDPTEALRRLRAAEETGRDRIGRAGPALDRALGRAYDAIGMRERATAHREAALLAWQGAAATLPAELRERFLAHPDRRLTAPSAPDVPASEARERPGAELRLARFFAVNRKLSAATEQAEVLEAAVDAAIELTGASRGFVLLSAEEGLTVAAARDAGGVALVMAELKFSRSIAERVVHEGQPLVTVDAQRDERFHEERSVHQMGLTSVACVPIRAAGELLGALYLDDRFRVARFSPADVELLEAFAAQVAIALRNARLVADLRARTEALERARATLAAELEGQAARIADLTESVRDKQRELELRHDYSKIIGRSAPMRAVLAQVDRLVDSDLSVLILGESGTGKELLARAIHYNGPRREGRLVSLNCAAMPENLIESELFGHVRGAFTGAERAREGILVAASGGTVFLDEVGEMPASMQAKLLRALEERAVRPVGSSSTVPFDARFVFATHRDLNEEVAAGRFRRDLYFRIGVLTLRVPPLRERMDDLVPLTRALMERHGARSISPAALERLRQHRFPGNVRELDNVLARASLLSERGRIDVADLDLGEHASSAPAPSVDREAFDAKRADELRAALDAAEWNVSQVARELGVPRQTIYRRLKRWGIVR